MKLFAVLFFTLAGLYGQISAAQNSQIGFKGKVYSMSELRHNTGRPEAGGWSAVPYQDAPQHLVFGPYATNWGEGQFVARFPLLIDNQYQQSTVVRLEVYDHTWDEVIASREVYTGEFQQTFQYYLFTLNFNTYGRTGHQMETRIYWYGSSYVRAHSIQVQRR